MDNSYPRPNTVVLKPVNIRILLPAFLALVAAGIVFAIGFSYYNLPHHAPLLTDSTLGELAVWMADQSAEPSPPSALGSWAKQWAAPAEQAGLDALLDLMQLLLLVWCTGTAVFLGIGTIGLLTRAAWTRATLIAGLIGLDALLLLIPGVDNTLGVILISIVLMLAVLLVSPGRVTKFIGFMVAISTLLVAWETAKPIAHSMNYAVVVGQQGWIATAYPTLDDALAALQSGEIQAVFADENDLEDLMSPYPEETTETSYPDLRYLTDLELQDQVAIFPVNPAMPGRLSVAVRTEDATQYTRVSQFLGESIGAVEADFALDKFLLLPRQLVLLDISFLNDLNLPHLQSIAEAFLQPARRNGEFLLVRILGDAGLFTLREAVFGFAFGVMFGLLLGIVFAHSRLMERALLPYVVASQTVPILALAPMVVIWLGANFLAVAVIAAYITFFPVAVNTLRGLQSPNPLQVELMQSYAASRWEILWKLRFPSALPYIFAALKVSATASVVGAIIGELPSGISDGLGRAILNFSSDYSLVSTPKLWAAIVTAAFVGILFFVSVNLVERVVLRRYVRS